MDLVFTLQTMIQQGLIGVFIVWSLKEQLGAGLICLLSDLN